MLCRLIGFRACFVVLFCFSVLSTFADIKLPQLVADHMVLQRDIKLKIWGWASADEKVSIAFNGAKANTTAGADGKWLVTLPAMKAGGPYTMQIKGNNQITLSDILIGDVWFCSGQSNMTVLMERVKERYPEEIATANFTQIRNFFVPTKSDVTKVYDDLPPGKWLNADAKNILSFGAVPYFFAKKIYLKYKIPIGIINSSVGGTPIEAWISAEGFKDFPNELAQIANFRDPAYMSAANAQQGGGGAPRGGGQATRPEPDKGISGPVKWTDVNFVPKNWHKFWMPGYWADQGVKGLNGILYFRKEVDVPASMTGVPAKLFVGRIIDADSTFVNGKYVGNITYQYPPRRYEVPAGLLKPGKNIIVVKVTSNSGKGGFVPDKNYSLNANGQRIDLRGEWTYQVGQVQPRLAFANGAGGSPRGAATAGNAAPRPRPVNAQNSPTGLYNPMVAPAINYGIKGFLWYQGEANSSRAKEYAKLLPALIQDWRTKWGQGDLPFIYAQLPNYMEVDYSPSESDWAQMRQSMFETLSVPNTGMPVAIDAGEWNDIHPLNKKDIGERMALWAEHLAYGDKSVVYSGPLYQSAALNGNKVTLSFTSTGSGLTTSDGEELYYFAIAGADKRYVWAKAKIEGDKVVVWNDAVPNPVSVRYAWADNPEGANLINKEGLLASPFQADIK